MNIENDPLEEAKEILNDLDYELENQRIIWKQIERDNPGFDPVSEENWKRNKAKSWFHGGTILREMNELERWLFDKPPLTKTAQKKAVQAYKNWRESLKPKGSDSWGAYYSDNPDFEISSPQKNEILIEFIIRLARSVEADGIADPLQWRALNSFLGFLRKTRPTEEVAFIEEIIPVRKDVFYGKIIRVIQPEGYPIPQETAAEILIELARICRTASRRDTQITAAESLGLCWLCLTSSRLRLPTHLTKINDTKAKALQIGKDLPILLVPTWFGDRPIKISHRISKFLSALSRIPSKTPREKILQRPPRSLTRMFDEALENISPNPEYGNITFVSLLSHPLLYGDHRPQPK